HRVKSMPTRLWSTPSSAPVSHSVDTSGLRLGFPKLSGTSPPPSGDVNAAYVVSLSKAPGWRPAFPIAARSRSVGSRRPKARSDHHDLSLGMTERLAFG